MKFRSFMKERPRESDTTLFGRKRSVTLKALSEGGMIFFDYDHEHKRI